ncbi:MAG: outer membrane lipoprotein carrier protein LolA [Zoogloeaceae bacterium]|nr:outer membrane lipoprotein carrier protein LolA [Zoogloeaceae bacterium]
MKRLGAVLALTLCALAAPVKAGFDLNQLMADLARHPGGRATFTERKYLAVLDKPVVSSGEMRFTPPGRMEKRTISPRSETLVLDQDVLTMERDKRRLSIRLDAQPEALAFVDSLRALLGGDRVTLERSYALQLVGDAQRWVLHLLPSDQRIAALVLRITVSGQANQVRSIEYLQADGDRIVLDLQPVAGS